MSLTLKHAREPDAFVLICPLCARPAYIGFGVQIPSARFGKPVAHIREQTLEDLYKEVRSATAVGASTAAVLCCRKILMHIAVSEGDRPGESFAHYVEFLAAKNYVPPDAKGWFYHIRLRGNEANHEIVLMSKRDAEEIVIFVEMLLRVIFEFPAKVQQNAAPPS
jgi:hypothetical protein